jgi:hypothetical protein
MRSTRTGSPSPTPTRSPPPSGSWRRTGSTPSAWSPAAAATAATCRRSSSARNTPSMRSVIHAAVYDLYAQTSADFAVHSERFGPYWENPEMYRTLSPHYYADRFDTPKPGHPRPERPARARRPGLRAVPRAADPRRGIEADLLPGREPLDPEAEQLASLVSHVDGLVQPQSDALLPGAPAPAAPALTRRRVLTWAGVAGAGAAATIVGWRRWSAAPGPVTDDRVPPAAATLAVLPFDDLSEDGEHQYFADGMQEELLARLAATAGLAVLSRTSTERFRGTRDAIP